MVPHYFLPYPLLFFQHLFGIKIEFHAARKNSIALILLLYYHLLDYPTLKNFVNKNPGSLS